MIFRKFLAVPFFIAMSVCLVPGFLLLFITMYIARGIDDTDVLLDNLLEALRKTEEVVNE